MDISRPQSKQPIPHHAQHVFKGILFDVYQWKQEMFDGSETMFEKLKRPDTVVVFPVLPDGTIMVTEQEQPGKEPFVGGAGGRIENNESPMEAAQRELREETGHTAERFILWDAQHPTSKIDWVVYTFVAKGIRKTSETNLDPGEKINLKLVSFDEFLNLGAQKNFEEKEIVPHLLQAQFDPKKKQELRELFDPNK